MVGLANLSNRSCMLSFKLPASVIAEIILINNKRKAEVLRCTRSLEKRQFFLKVCVSLTKRKQKRTTCLTDGCDDGRHEEQCAIELPLHAGFMRDRPDDVVANHVEVSSADVVLRPHLQFFLLQLRSFRFLERRLQGIENGRADEQVGESGRD